MVFKHNIKTNNNIIIVGFMGSGKSRVGADLAEKLGFTFIDLDQEVEKIAGKIISEIFLESGEAGFRAYESRALNNLKTCQNCVMSTGGGTPMFFENAEILRSLGQIFFLDLAFEVIASRLKKSQKRPLAQHDSAEDYERLEKLYAFRRPIYQNLGISIDVNHQDKSRSVSEIFNIYNALVKLEKLESIKVLNNKKYDIYIDSASRFYLKDIIIASNRADFRPFIITTTSLTTLFNKHIEEIENALSKTLTRILIPDGEAHKNTQSLEHIHGELFKQKASRQSLILAMGGGVVGDLAGYAAATYMRGIPIIHIPTSLLAMTDAAIGGKSAVDNHFGKNLLGAFHNPEAVLVDLDFLESLPPHEYACGMAEVIKHALIGDKELFYALLEKRLSTKDMLMRSIAIKARIVAKDPHEKNIRAYLNLGHTIAHALEKVSNYTISHGHAVAIGLVLESRVAEREAVLEEDFIADLIKLLEHYKLPTKLPENINKNALIDALSYDKKRDSYGLRIILPKRIAEVVERYISVDKIREILDESL
jgi:shikimate kinase/3-dehydroquinate synthase